MRPDGSSWTIRGPSAISTVWGQITGPWLEKEKGPLGISLLRAAFEALDPDGRMNSGKLV